MICEIWRDHRGQHETATYTRSVRFDGAVFVIRDADWWGVEVIKRICEFDDLPMEYAVEAMARFDRPFNESGVRLPLALFPVAYQIAEEAA